MPSPVALATRYRDSPALSCVLWGAIALGIVPAIVAQNILPFDTFVLRFGVEIDQIRYLPGSICLLLFAAGAAAAVIRRQYWCILLLLPLLALYGYDLDRLTFKLPSYSDAQDELRDNLNRSREQAAPPAPNKILESLGQVEFTDGNLIAFDRAAIEKELTELAGKQQSIGSDRAATIEKLEKDIKPLEKKIRQARTQRNRILKALRDTAFVSWLSLGLADPHLKDRLNTGLRAVDRQINAWISKRNALYAALKAENRALSAIEQRLYRLGAEVETYLWASKSLESWRISRAYGFACFLVLLVIVARYSLGSWIYLFTLSAALAVSLLYVEAPLAFRCWTILSFVLVSLILRVLYLACVNNYPLLRRQSGSFLAKASAATLAYYIPFIVLIFAGFYLSNSIAERFESEVYAVAWIGNSDPDRDTLRYDIDIGIDKYFDDLERNAQRDLTRISNRGKAGIDKIRGGVIEAYTTTFPPDLGPEFDVSPCKWPHQWAFDTANCVRDEVAYSLNEGYSKIRADQLEALRQSTQLYAERAKELGNQPIDIAREDLDDNILAVRLTIKKLLSRIYSAYDFYNGLAAILLALMILKSLLYLFARIFFGLEPEDGKRLIQFEPNPRPAQHGTIREISERLDLTPEMGERFFVSKRFDFANAPPDEVTPQAHKALFSRFVNGVWHLNRIETGLRDPATPRPYRLVPGDERVVAWTLKPGDAVIFSWRHFIGMNEAIRIRTRYSWQLSSLIFGRMFFVVASVDPESPADGCLLLNARGSHGIDAADNPSNSPDQLLAWQTTTRFQLHARLTLRNIYRSGIQIRAMESDLAVMHLNPGKRKSGAAAFLKYFLVPV
ncbi:MAG: hypothetical protein PVI70_14885 [Gammaproteobacteria bacterium]|jgi:hypothetical protein